MACWILVRPWPSPDAEYPPRLVHIDQSWEVAPHRDGGTLISFAGVAAGDLRVEESFQAVVEAIEHCTGVLVLGMANGRREKEA